MCGLAKAQDQFKATFETAAPQGAFAVCLSTTITESYRIRVSNAVQPALLPVRVTYGGPGPPDLPRCVPGAAQPAAGPCRPWVQAELDTAHYKEPVCCPLLPCANSNPVLGSLPSARVQAELDTAHCKELILLSFAPMCEE